jgi:hypothetical protein
MKKTFAFVLFAALLSCVAHGAPAADCSTIAARVKQAVAGEPAKVLEIVKAQVAANEACACEVVKAAILASKADATLVASIVEVASTTAPEQMRLVGQCALAVAPDSLASVQAVLTKLDPGAGESADTAKGGIKDALEKGPIQEVAAIPNPLDFPGFPPIGRGTPLVIPIPPVIIIPEATDTLFSNEK